jgi:SOS-response transcriptional repressor LexA
MEVLSPQQQKVYDFIEAYHGENGISPSMADIAEGLGLANSTIATYVEVLRKKKRVTSMAGVPRSLRVVPEAAAVN